MAKSWANWGWLQPLKEILRTRLDLLELSRCGFDVRFPSSKHCLPLQSAEVALQDSEAKSFGTLTATLVQEHAAHMMWWSEGYPGKLMRFFGDEPEAK